MASSPTLTATYRPAHVLSEKSSRQHRNVFIWCTVRDKVALGWRVGDDSPVTLSTAYRWITTAVETQSPGWKDIDSFTLCPVHVRPSGVLTYRVRQNGAALPRESHDIIAPGDYGVYTRGDDSDPRLYFRFDPEFSFASMEIAVEMNSPSLLSKASLTSTLIKQAMDRDHKCLFSGVPPGRNSDELVASWIFPPFLGYKLSNERNSMGRYFAEPETCDLSELMVIENVICGRKDIIALFWENKLGVDVDECLAVSVCLGDVREDYEEQEIELFMEDLGVYDNEIDPSDPRWSTKLGSYVYDCLVRQGMAGAFQGSLGSNMKSRWK